jgi:hypothetical protein
MENLIKKLENLNSGSPENIELLIGLFEEVAFKKGWVLSNTLWQVSPTLYYISTGLLKCTVEDNGTVFTLWMLHNGFLVPGSGFLAVKTIDEIVECLKNTKAFTLNLRKANKLAKDNPKLYQILLEIFDESLMEGRKRELMLRIKNAKKRHQYFKDNYPELNEILTTDQVADCININRNYFYSILK